MSDNNMSIDHVAGRRAQRKVCIGLIALSLVAITVGAENDGCRTFTDAEGRTIKAKLVEFDSARRKLLIAREDGNRVWVTPNVFSEEDRSYIQQWVSAFQMISEDNLEILINRQSLGKFGNSSSRERGEKICFKVNMKNKRSAPIEGLSIEYQYFLDVEYVEGNNRHRQVRVTGKIPATHIAGGERFSAQTSPVALSKVYTIETTKKYTYHPGETPKAKYETDKNMHHESKLQGIWIKIVGSEIDGDPVVRDICIPPQLKKKVSWDSKTEKGE